ncbi:DUF1788 domain-containing protein [Jeotgalibaca caeni]|uniref:DUF1788 domain-containing protein n=1 Tax=Jeotgalibaca caeni TaxID=3028623 RepID=UPI00237D4516|nr:DUF1788 domain-containing protein [Jeotgalibaca caeni]MDE1549712.1 DUF1788 domain-containing protein [Jeotgalibaca caeni]
MKRSLEERLDLIQEEISKPTFRANKGLGNEVGYYVFDYPAEEELKVRAHVEFLKRRNQKSMESFELMVFDVYDIMLDFIEQEDLLEACFEMEAEEGMDYLVESVSALLEMSENHNYFSRYIEEHSPENAVVFITGIGKIFPFVRSHKILNNLHQVFDRVPVVLFYPGKYDGLSLMLFSEFKDDNYYRAFELVK